MNYTIFIPQEKILQVAPKISLEACVVLDYLSRWQLVSKDRAKKALFDNEEYMWIHYPTLIENLPLLRINRKNDISDLIDELKRYDFIKKQRTADNTVYIRLTDKAAGLYQHTIQAVAESDTGLYQRALQHNPNTNNPIKNTDTPKKAVGPILDTVTTTGSSESISYEIDDSLVKTKNLSRKELIKNKGYDPATTNELLAWGEAKLGRSYPKPLVQKAAISAMLAAKWTAQEIKEAWEMLEADDYWQDKGIDFKLVMSQISKSKKAKPKGGISAWE